MKRMLQRIVASVLLFVNCTQILAAVLPSYATDYQKKNSTQFSMPADSAMTPLMDSFTVATNQLGLSGPLSAWATYSNLTGLFFTGQYLKKLTDMVAVGVLGEYGDDQYRVNGTVGFSLAENSFLKISGEHFSQRLPFSFDTGNIEKRVGQNAFGARFQNNFTHGILNNVNVGGYYARANDVSLSAVRFVSNGFNCAGAQAGLQCINERNIAGATSLGADIGTGLFLTPISALEGNIYYDKVHYNTIFSPDSNFNDQGLGWGLNAEQIVQPNLKFSAGAEVRKIYDTYNVAVSWLPPFTTAAGSELALILQRVVSHNPTPDNDSVGLRFTLLTDKTNYEEKIYKLNKKQTVSDIGMWVQNPAVKMNQVLAIAEQFTHLIAPSITGITPNNGPIAGGNVVVISGTNFPSNSLVRFGGQIAVISSVTVNSITVTVPAAAQAGAVDVSITTPDNQTVTLSQAYLYSDNAALPQIATIFPNIANVAGLSGVVITGTGFIPGDTLVEYTVLSGRTSALSQQPVLITPTSVTTTKIVFDAPPHEPGPINVRVLTSKGASAVFMGGFMYITSPTVTMINPDAGPTSGVVGVSIEGSGFIEGDTSVIFDGATINPTSVSSETLVFNAPAHAQGNVTVSVRTPAGTSANIGGGFTYNAPLSLISISPGVGSVQGVQNITLTGTGFVRNNTIVNIDGQDIAADVTSSTTLTFDAPNHAPATVNVYVKTGSEQSQSLPFVYTTAPVISNITPSAATLAGRTGVLLNGSGFVASSIIYFDNLAITPDSISSSQLVFTAPPATVVGMVDVKVVTPAATSAVLVDGFNYIDATAIPTATAINKTQGSVNGQANITLTGTNFVAGNTFVNIGGSQVSTTVISPTQLTFDAPLHSAGQVSVTAQTPAGVSNPVNGGFTYIELPVAMSLSPSSGPLNTQIPVTLGGLNFTPDTQIYVNGNLITPITVVSATEIQFTIPAAMTSGSVSISVSTPGGTVSLNGGFTYLNAPTAVDISPNQIPLSGQSSLIITGTNFTSDAQVFVAGAPATITNITPTTIQFDASMHSAGNVAVLVQTAGGSATVPGGLTYTENPVIASIAPNVLATNAPADVVITGSGFVAGNTIVSIGAEQIAAVVNSSTQLTVSVPSHPTAESVTVSVTTPVGGSSPLPNALTFVDAPQALSLSISTGNLGGVNGITIQGTGFVPGATTVTMNNQVVPSGAYNISGTSLTFDAPSTSNPGNVSVIVTTPGGSSTVPGGFTYTANPTLNTISPSSSNLSGIAGVVLTGSGFIAGQTVVNIGAQTVAASVSDDNTLTFTAPGSLTAENVSVTVTVNGVTSNPVVGGFTYTSSPTLSNVSPTIVPTIGQVTLTINGSGFVIGGTTVTVDGTSVTPVNVALDGQSLTIEAPAHAEGNASITLTTIGGSTTTVNALYYAGTPAAGSLSPTSVPLNGYNGITLSGSGFIPGSTTITLDGVVYTPYNVSATSLMFNAPQRNATGDVILTVTTPIGTSSPITLSYIAAPQVGSLTPNVGPSTGSSGVVLSGSNFTQDAKVNFNGSMINPTNITSSSLTFDVPAFISGSRTVNVSVTTTAGTSANVGGGFTYVDSPTVASISPTTAPIGGQVNIIITGTNFTQGSVVNVDAQQITPSSISPTSITFLAPSHAAGSVDISVTTPIGNSNVLTNALNYVGAPTAQSVQPNASGLAGGGEIVINGTNFVPNLTRVTVDATQIDAVQVNLEGTRLTFTAPNHAAGTVNISVATPSGSTGNIFGGFTYADSPTTSGINPALVAVSGATSVTISGTNFIPGSTTLTVDGNLVATTSITPTTITFNSPMHDVGNAIVNVITPIGSSTINLGYQVAPVISSIIPGAVAIGGQTEVVINGNGFVSGLNATKVNLDGQIYAANVTSPTTLKFDAPPHAQGTVDISVTTPIGTSANFTSGFIYAGVPSVSSLSPTLVPTSGFTGVTVNGNNFLPNYTQVNVGGVLYPANVLDSSTLKFNAPSGSGTTSLNVITPGGTSGALTLTYVSSPTVGTLTPNSGSTNGVRDISLSGSGFINGNTVVNFDNMSINPTSVTANTLIFDAPPHAAGQVAVSVTTPGGTSSNVGTGFTYQLAPTLTSCRVEPRGFLVQALICTGVNVNAFGNNPYINVQGGLTCSIGAGLLAVTNLVVGSLGLEALTNNLLVNTSCSVRLCVNSACTGLTSNLAVIS